MTLTLGLFLALGLVAVPLIQRRRGGSFAAMFFAVALVYALIFVIGLLSALILRQFSDAPPIDTAELAEILGQGAPLWSPAIAMVLLAGFVWAQERLQAMRFPRLVLVLFWLVNIGLFLTILPQVFFGSRLELPPALVDLPAFGTTLTAMSNLGAFVCFVASISIIALGAWSVWITLLRSDRV